MERDERRQAVLSHLQSHDDPVTGSDLAAAFGVTRQVIVQDVAVLRAAGHEILATPQGYQVPASNSQGVRKRLVVKHAPSAAAIREELNLIVDHGAKVIDVTVEHPVYGELTGLLMLESRYDVDQFLRRLDHAEPLSVLTGGVHLHTVQAAGSAVIARVEKALDDAGFGLSDDVS